MQLFRKTKQSSHGTPAVRTPSPLKQTATPSNGCSTNACLGNTSTRTGSAGQSTSTSNSASSRSIARTREPPPPPYLSPKQQENLMTQAVKAYMTFYKRNKTGDRDFAKGLELCAIRHQPQLKAEINKKVGEAIEAWETEVKARAIQAGSRAG